MKRTKLTFRLPWLVPALGAVGMVLRWCLYQIALDDRLLLRPGHPLEILVWLLTAGTAAWIVACTWRQKEPATFEGNFPPSRSGCIGSCGAAFLICYTVLSQEARIPGVPGIAWKVLGVLCAPSLLAAGFGRMMGKKTSALCFLVPCLFFLSHIVTNYRAWGSEPQMQTLFFPLLSSVFLTFFLFHTAAFGVDIPHRGRQMGTGLAGAYLCIVDLSRTEYPWLCLAGAILCMTSLCALDPADKGENHHDPA